jgi:hypothetical protein
MHERLFPQAELRLGVVEPFVELGGDADVLGGLVR